MIKPPKKGGGGMFYTCHINNYCIHMIISVNKINKSKFCMKGLKKIVLVDVKFSFGIKKSRFGFKNHRHITWVGFEPRTFATLEQCHTN